MNTKKITHRIALLSILVAGLFTLLSCGAEGAVDNASADVNYSDFFIKELGITEEQNEEYIAVLSECGIKNITTLIEYSPVNGYNYYSLATKDPNYSGIALFTDSDNNIVKVQYNSTVLYDGSKVLASIADFEVEDAEEEKYKELTIGLITEQFPNNYIEYTNYSNGPHFSIIDPAKNAISFSGIALIKTDNGESKYIGFQSYFIDGNVKEFTATEMPSDFDINK